MKEKEVKHKGDREVSFIDKGVKAWLDENRENNGLCLQRFNADLVIEGLVGKCEGDIVEHNGNQYEIAKVGKKCFAECELLKELGTKCPLADGVAFGKTL